MSEEGRKARTERIVEDRKIIMKKCPVCGSGELKKGEIEEEMFGISLGRCEAEICDTCGESFVDEANVRTIEQKAKKLGIWGIGKKIKVVRAGE